MEALELARLQFAMTASFHFFFVVLTLGLAPAVAILETRYVLTGHPLYERMTRFWGQVYVINYALGIVTGLIMEFQFGFAWSGLSKFVGNVFGAPIALETLLAFFLESTFLGMWIFGWHKLGRKTHCLLIWLVSLTAYMSAFWIMVANSFMQHPVGYEVRDGVGYLTDFGALLTNQSLWYALPHITGAAGLVTGLLMVGAAAYHFFTNGELRRSLNTRNGPVPSATTEDRDLFVRTMRMGVVFAALGSMLNFSFSFEKFGYLESQQPMKLAYFFGPGREGQLQVQGREGQLQVQEQLTEQLGSGDYLLPAWVSIASGVMEQLGFFLLTAAVMVLPLLLPFSLLLRFRVLSFLAMLLPPLPFVATIAGWLYREVGRQPWVVYGELNTAEAVSPIGAPALTASLVGFSLLIATLTVINWTLILRTIGRGPRQVKLGARPEEETADPNDELAIKL